MDPTRPSTARPEEFDEFDTLGNEYGDLYEPTNEERTLGLLSHLSSLSGFIIPFGNILGPLLMYLIKREESEFAADQAREALNFNITMTLAMIVAAVLMIVLIGFLLLPALGLAWVVLTIIAAIKANEGEWYQYPFTLRLVK
jgi:uncharacterized Tic20 family protein